MAGYNKQGVWMNNKSGIYPTREAYQAAEMPGVKTFGAKAATKAPAKAAPQMTAPQLGSYQGATRNGKLKDQYALKAGPEVKLNMTAMDELRKQALAKESPWLAQQLQQNTAQGLQAQNRAAQGAATAAASGQAALARRGGLSSGAAERMAMGAQENRLLGQQEAAGQTDMNRLNLMVNDAQSQRGLLQAMPGMELGLGQFGQAERQYQTGVEQSNIQNALADLGAKQGFDLKKYEEQMKGYGAEKSAQATEKAGGGGSVICTALLDVGLISPEEQRKAAEFRSEVSHETYKAYLRWGTPVANMIRTIPVLGYFFKPLVRYWMGDRDILAKAQYAFFKTFNKLFLKKSFVEAK